MQVYGQDQPSAPVHLIRDGKDLYTRQEDAAAAAEQAAAATAAPAASTPAANGSDPPAAAARPTTKSKLPVSGGGVNKGML